MTPTYNTIEPTYNSEAILFALDSTRQVHPRKVTIELADGMTSWDPSSTSRLIYGPASVTYTQHAGGAVEAEVR